MRRSSRLRKKKRVNYNEDSLWERAVRGARNLGDRLEAGAPEKKAPKPIFQKKQLFRPKIRPNAKPKLPKQLVRVRNEPKAEIERDGQEGSYLPTRQGCSTPSLQPNLVGVSRQDRRVGAS